MDYGEIIPYTCVYLDACWRDLYQALQHSVTGCSDRERLVSQLKKLWTHPENPNHVLPCLSVRTALDMYLQVKNFPPGSQLIVSALNIPDMVHVIRHHGIEVVPLDVNLDTMAPRIELLESLITERTVGILVAHIYGKWVDMTPFVSAAQSHGLALLEDCAEVFCGLDRIGHPQTDVALFSFGVIKTSTAFGGAIAKIKDDDIHQQMAALNATYPLQPHAEYFKKVLKYTLAYIFLNCPNVIKPILTVNARTMNIDHKRLMVNALRGFPNDLIIRLRHQPSTSLLFMMLRRMKGFDARDYAVGKIKGDYISERLPEGITQVGTKAFVNNYWLFPIVVEQPDEFLKILNRLGVDAYRGATQLNIIEPRNGNGHLNSSHLKHLDRFVTHYPHNAKFLIDHVVYLPVNKTVPFHDLDKICQAVEIAVERTKHSGLPKVKVQSKL